MSMIQIQRILNDCKKTINHQTLKETFDSYEIVQMFTALYLIVFFFTMHCIIPLCFTNIHTYNFHSIVHFSIRI